MIYTDKMYCFYLKHGKKLYAVTTLKKERDRFLKERNPKCFDVVTKTLDCEVPESVILEAHPRLILRDYPLLMDMNAQGDSTYNMLLTGFEESMLDEVSESITSIIDDVAGRLVKIGVQEGSVLDDKYRFALRELKRTHVQSKETKGLYSTINTFKIFANLMQFTFDPSVTPSDTLEPHDHKILTLVNILDEYCPSMHLYAM